MAQSMVKKRTTFRKSLSIQITYKDNMSDVTSRPKVGRFRKRPVSFGNPSLGTYQGIVYTTTTDTDNVHTYSPQQQQQQQVPIIEGASPVERLVAMVHVPPEQVPEGVLNLVRAHRPWIEHVRIMIEEDDDEDEEEERKNDPPSDTKIKEQTTLDAGLILDKDAGRQTELESPTTSSSQPQVPSRSYLVLFELSTEQGAQQLVQYLHGQPFTCLDEEQTCSLYHVIALEGQDGVSLLSPLFAPTTKTAGEGTLEIVPSGSEEAESTGTNEGEDVKRAASSSSSSPPRGAPHTDDYNCAVCLERMLVDRDSTSAEKLPTILTTVCNHSFHMDCLLQWQDSPCPVCRYDHSGLNEALSQCHICFRTENNFVCLICGIVSCGGGRTQLGPPPATVAASRASLDGTEDPQCRLAETDTATVTDEESASQRMPSSHARQHYDTTLHAYALDTETQHVWDFAGQGYVHRLMQNKDDGKLVEVNDPSNTSSQERTLRPGLSDHQEGEVVHRKLEGFASRYYTLLKSQLEQQRIFYEGRLQEIRRQYDRKEERPRKHTSDLITALKQERHQLSQRLGSLQSRHSKVREDIAFLRSMNESLEANKAPLKKQLADAQQNRVEAQLMFQECLPKLQEKVTMLMLQLESDANQATAKPVAK